MISKFINKNDNPHKKIAFTLAEVLITLGIIGVVAALTIPNLIKSYQKKVTVEKLKSTYAILQQAIRLSEVDNGPVATWDIPVETNSISDNNYTKGKQFAETYLFPYMSVTIKDCGIHPNKCLPDKVLNLNKFDNSSYYNATSDHTFTFILKNGTTISERPIDSSNGGITFLIYLDGKKKPSVRGKNTFIINLSHKGMNGIWGNVSNKSPGFYFQGYGYDRNTLKTSGRGCNKNGTGDYCGELIRYDGWKISKDYPW